MTEPRFNVPLDTKQVISEMLFPANLLASTEKINIKAGRKNHNNVINLG